MTWKWYPKAWNDFADRSFNPAVGCSNENCNTRHCCWARRQAKRRRPKYEKYVPCPISRHNGPLPARTNLVRGCRDCYEFRVHEHWERWPKFHVKIGKRIAFCIMGDLLSRSRADDDILRHLDRCVDKALDARWRIDKRSTEIWLDRQFYPQFLIQTRNVQRLIDLIPKTREGWNAFAKTSELGTSFTGPADIPNVRALGELPDDVVRFIAFEPCDSYMVSPLSVDEQGPLAYLDDIRTAKPNWTYIGLQTPLKHSIGKDHRVNIVRIFASELERINCKIIYKRSCGPELYKRNEGVVLP